MLKALLLVVLLALSGCSTSRNCYVGVSLFPLGPFIHCGVGIEPGDDKEELDLNV